MFSGICYASDGYQLFHRMQMNNFLERFGLLENVRRRFKGKGKLNVAEIATGFCKQILLDFKS